MEETQRSITLNVFFSPAQYCPNGNLGGAQRRFGKDDECQIEECQRFHSVREECHLEDENSFACRVSGGEDHSQMYFAITRHGWECLS